MGFKELYKEYKKACERIQFIESDIKEILTNIEYGKYTDNELLLEYKNLKALQRMKIERGRKVEETKKALVENGYFITCE